MEVENPKLKVYSRPDLNSEVVCQVRYVTEFIVGITGSTEDFYKIYVTTGNGVDDYCRKNSVFRVL